MDTRDDVSPALPARYVQLLGILALVTAGAACGKSLPDRHVAVNRPYAEWRISYPGASGNPYDIEATAVFTHDETGTTRRSLMFYAGQNVGDGHTWKFRFTGTRTGTWSVKTKGPGNLDGWTGTVEVAPGEKTRKGFVTTDGRAWIWGGTGEAFVPQFVMMNRPSAFREGGSVDTKKIDRTIQEFAVETGFTGFHFAGGGGKWFKPGAGHTKSSFTRPSPATFDVLRTFIMRAYAHDAATHIWLYGSDAYGPAGGPANLGGPRSKPVKRVLRQIAGRLGPIPGWSMGYGFDLQRWADADELEWYRNFLSERLGGWQHPIGARADEQDHFPEQHRIRRQPVSEVYWKGDYVGHYDKRVSYRHYVRTYDFAGKPAFQEDRFRIRMKDQFQSKDYTPEMTVRGLWHSTMAGGVANIWANLLPHSRNELGSRPYDNKAQGTIRGVDFTVDIKDAIKTYHRFWFEEGRFSSDLVRSNGLTEKKVGGEALSARDPSPISVALRGPDDERFIFYAEQTRTVTMDLRSASSPLQAIAVNTRRAYEEIAIGRLEPETHSWEAPRESDWAVAVGKFDK